jgi:hypothetical protein
VRVASSAASTAALGDRDGLLPVALAGGGDGIDGLAGAQAFVGGQALQAGIGVERGQALAERGGRVAAGRGDRLGPLERRNGRVVGAQLQALAQAGDFRATLFVVGPGGRGAAARKGEFAIGRRGFGEMARCVFVATRHRRLRGGECVAGRGQVRRRVLVRIGVFGARDGLLCSRQLARRRRQACATGHRDSECGGHHKAAAARVLRYREVCEAWAHIGVPCRGWGKRAAIVESRRRACKRPPRPEGVHHGHRLFPEADDGEERSDMFLTTGAPVYIKVEGKLYPAG